jgi:hypothetical protein
MATTNIQKFAGDVEVAGGLTVTGTVTTTVGTDKVNLSGTTANETDYIPLSKGATGAQGLYTDSNLTYNPSTNQIDANISGSAGSAGSATNATYANSAGSATNATYANSAGSATNASAVAFTDRDSNNEADYIAFVSSHVAGNYGLYTDSNLTYNPANNTINGTANYANSSGYAGSSGYATYGISYGANIYIGSGNVGVNTGSPGAKLHVNGTGPGTLGTTWATYLTAGYRAWVSRGQYSVSTNISIWATNDIAARGNMWAHRATITTSDRRIKQDITDVDDDYALDQIRLLQPKRYKYIDIHTQGGTDEKVMGFIAQEVANVIPEAISIQQEYIPNIYGLNFIEADDIIRFETFNINDFESEEPIKLRLCNDNSNSIDTTITEIIDDHTVRIEFDDTMTYSNLYDAGMDVANEDGTFSKMVFVYGEKVDDLHTLRKDAIWTTATAALQEVDRQLQSEKTKVEILETQVADLITRVTNLEAAT